MEELDIDREFEAMCPALLPDEYRLLEEGILADGCRDPIVLWKGVILDGHNRYKICRKHNIVPKTKTLNLPDREAAVKWIARNQLGRRNLNEGQRATLAARMVTATVGGDHSANLQNGVITTADAAELCNVSPRTVASAKKVIDHGSAALQQSVAAGEVAPSVAAKVAELPKAEQRKVVAKGPKAVKAKAKEITEAGKVKQYNDTFDPATDMKKPKNGSEKKTQFKDSTIDDLFGKLLRSVDDRWNLIGNHGNKYRVLVAKLRESFDAWKDWRASK